MNNFTSVRLEITSGCNLNCKYCHNQKFNNKKDDMSIKDILKLIKELKDIMNIDKILITGGEPLINPHVYEIISYITRLGIKADMVTNGILLNETTIKKLENAGLKRVRISIDEVGKESEVRIGENPELLWRKAKFIRENTNIEVCIHTVCSMSNVDSLFEIYKNVLKCGVQRWRVFDISFQNDSEYFKKTFKPIEYYNKLINASKKIIKSYLSNELKNLLDIEINNIFRSALLEINLNQLKSMNYESMLKERLEKSPCDYVTEHQITIRSNGVSTLCQYFHDSIYDFRRYKYCTIKALRNQKKRTENIICMRDVKPCAECRYCLICNSGCRARAKYLTENIYNADPAACYMYMLIYERLVPILPDNLKEAYLYIVNRNGKSPKYSEKQLCDLFRKRGFDV